MPKFCSCPKIVHRFFSINNFFAEQHHHVLYEEVYQYKRFQKFSTKTVTRIASPNCKNEQKRGQSSVGVKGTGGSFVRTPGFLFCGRQAPDEWRCLNCSRIYQPWRTAMASWHPEEGCFKPDCNHCTSVLSHQSCSVAAYQHGFVGTCHPNATLMPPRCRPNHTVQFYSQPYSIVHANFILSKRSLGW